MNWASHVGGKSHKKKAAAAAAAAAPSLQGAAVAAVTVTQVAVSESASSSSVPPLPTVDEDLEWVPLRVAHSLASRTTLRVASWALVRPQVTDATVSDASSVASSRPWADALASLVIGNYLGAALRAASVAQFVAVAALAGVAGLAVGDGDGGES